MSFNSRVKSVWSILLCWPSDKALQQDFINRNIHNFQTRTLEKLLKSVVLFCGTKLKREVVSSPPHIVEAACTPSPSLLPGNHGSGHFLSMWKAFVKLLQFQENEGNFVFFQVLMWLFSST